MTIEPLLSLYRSLFWLLQAVLDFVCAARNCFDAGGCPAAGYFILLVQNTSNQIKRHPAAPALRASLGFPGESGGCVKLGLRPQTNAADGPRFARKTEAVQKGILVLWA
jgi:hypothetical protein